MQLRWGNPVLLPVFINFVVRQSKLVVVADVLLGLPEAM